MSYITKQNDNENKKDNAVVVDNKTYNNKEDEKKADKIKVKDGEIVWETDTTGYFNDKRDDIKYEVVKIGNQIWMAENLAYKINTGCWAYDNKENNVAIYGRLYNWETAHEVCPNGWHLPDKEEFYTMLGNIEGYKGMKLRSINGWNEDFEIERGYDAEIRKYYGNGNNLSGFNSKPSPYLKEDGTFSLESGKMVVYWCADVYDSMDEDEACALCLLSSDPSASISCALKKKSAYSVRCLKD